MDIPPDLVRSAQSGDRDALEDLIGRSYRPAYTLALRMLGNPDDAAEATQEAFIRLVRSLKGFREVGAYPTWMFRIVTNVCLTQMRRRSRRDIPMDLETVSEIKGDLQPVDAEEIAIDRVFRSRVEECLSRLPEAYRSVVVLRDVYGMSGDETAKILGTSTGAVKVRLHRARRRLRDELESVAPGWGSDGGQDSDGQDPDGQDSDGQDSDGQDSDGQDSDGRKASA